MNLTIFLSWGYTQSLHPAHFLFALFSTSMSSSRQKFFTAFWFPSAPSSWLAQALPPPLYQWEVSSPFHPSPLLLFLSFFFFFLAVLASSLCQCFSSDFISVPNLSFFFPIFSSLCPLLKHPSFSQEQSCFFSPAYSTSPSQHIPSQVPCPLKGTLS